MSLERESDMYLADNRALSSIQSTIGVAPPAQAEDVEMAPEGALPAEVEAKFMATNAA
jgi:pre-mRNA-processing factor 19